VTAGPILVSGAGGFIGRALTQHLLSRPGAAPGRLTLVDIDLSHAPADARCIEGDLAGPGVLDQALDPLPSLVIHLASVPSAASEARPELSRAVNLDATLALFDRLAKAERPIRLVYASSIAALGSRFGPTVDDDTPPRPSLTYGAHKLMAETALTDWSRRGRLDGIALRLPGIVARPRQAGGFGSGFWSDVFHALVSGEPYVAPVGPEATAWLMSVRACVENLVHATGIPPSSLGPIRAFTLPALHVRMADLLAEIAASRGGRADLVSFAPLPELETQFGRYPPLATAGADALGFRHDGSLGGLVGQVLEDLK